MLDEETWVPGFDDPQRPGQPGNWIRFNVQAIKNGPKSVEMGRPIYDERYFVEIKGPGIEKQIPAYEVKYPDPKTRYPGNEYYHRYQKQADAFRAGGMEGISGTPLNELPFLSKADVAEIKGAKINTLEMLAGLNENTLIQMGPGFRSYHDKAKAYLQKANDLAPLTQMQKQIDDLKEALRAAEENSRSIAAAAQAPREKLKLKSGEAA